MPEKTAPTIRPFSPADEHRWRALFRAYREFYELPESEEVVSRVWGWLMDPRHECEALVAEVDGEVVGFAHLRRFSSPTTAPPASSSTTSSPTPQRAAGVSGAP